MWESAIDHELQEIAVGVSEVDARTVGPAAAVPCHRSFFDGDANFVEKGFERLGRPLPHEAEVAAGWRGGRCAQGESVALPQLGPVEVDHLVARIHRDDGAELDGV